MGAGVRAEPRFFGGEVDAREADSDWLNVVRVGGLRSPHDQFVCPDDYACANPTPYSHIHCDRPAYFNADRIAHIHCHNADDAVTDGNPHAAA
jgi:hypothetical protein